MLAAPIENYTFRSTTPTEELEVMCRLLTEVAGYASTFADKAHATQARKCEKAQRKVERELIKREGEAAIDEAFATPQSLINTDDLTALSIDELEQLFRQRPKRIEARLSEGRDISSHFFETKIVRELKKRHPLTPIEQLKKDYCLRINRQELDNLAHLTQMPIGTPSQDAGNCLTPEELIREIQRLQNPKTVMEREILQQHIDQALDLLKALTPKQKGASLAATLTTISWKGTKVPTWIKGYLIEALKDWQKHPEVPATDMVLPLLTAYQETQDEVYKRQAQRIINRCYKAVTAKDVAAESPVDFIEMMYIAVKCCEYVTRFNRMKVAESWQEFCKDVDVRVMAEGEKEEKMREIERNFKI